MNRILTGAKFEIKALNLNKFYSDVANELGIKKSSLLEMGVQERVHHHDKTRTVTTTQIAAGHEFGNTYTPPRPFLSKSANVFVNGDFSKEVKEEYTYLGAFLKRLAKKLYSTVVECFMSGGFGSWLSLSEKYKKRTGRTEPPLLDTGKLLSSVYVRYGGFTISGKSTGGMVSSSELFVVKDDSKRKSETKVKTPTKRIVQKAKESRAEQIAREQQEAQKTMEEYLRHSINIKKSSYIRQYGAKEYKKNQKTLEENWTNEYIAEMLRRNK